MATPQFIKTYAAGKQTRTLFFNTVGQMLNDPARPDQQVFALSLLGKPRKPAASKTKKPATKKKK